MSVPNAVYFCPEEQVFCMEIHFHVQVKRMITSLCRKGKTALKSDGVVVVPTFLSNLTITLFMNPTSIHMKRAALSLIVNAKYSIPLVMSELSHS